MMPYGLNGQWHYADCKEVLNSHPGCSCISSMAKQIAILAEENAKLHRANRHLRKVVDNAQRN
jgi:regulator of replication initiation timing